MVASAKIGPIITGTDVEKAMENTVRKWAPDYLAEVASQSGRARGDLPTFRSYVHMMDMTKFSEDQVPACVVVAPGTADSPAMRHDGYEATWVCGVGCVVSGQNEANSYELCTLYLAAVRAMIVQHKSLGGFANNSVWLGERYDELGSNEERSIVAGLAQFNVTVTNVIDQRLGLIVPSVDATVPPGDWPVADTVTITVKER